VLTGRATLRREANERLHVELTRPRSHVAIRDILLAVVSCVLALALAGCVPAEGGAPKQLQSALEQANSSETTVQLSLKQLQSGKTLPTTASTTAEQMLTQVQSAQKDAEGVSVDTSKQSKARDKVVNAIAATSRAVLEAQHYLENTKTGDLDAVLRRFADNRTELKSLHASLAEQR
jgi:hypothetical protein